MERGKERRYWYSRVTRRSDEEQAAMDSSISNVAITLCCQFLAKVCRVLILNVLDNRFPAYKLFSC